MEDHLSVICGTDKGCTQGQVISIEDFQRQRFLLREKGSGTREVFNRVVEQAGIHITPVGSYLHRNCRFSFPLAGIGGSGHCGSQRYLFHRKYKVGQKLHKKHFLSLMGG